MFAAAAGQAIVMRTNHFMFQTAQRLCAAWLCWIGLQLLRTRLDPASAQAEPACSSPTYSLQALACNVTKPKVSLFFVSFFPLLLKLSTSTTIGVMMRYVTALSFLYQGALMPGRNLFAARLKQMPAARRLVMRAAGETLLGFSA